MKNNLIKTILLVGCSFLTNCENSIEIPLSTEQINRETVFENEKTAESALSNLYMNLRDNSIFSGGSSGLSLILGYYTDEQDYLNNLATAPYYLLYTNNLNPNYNIISTIWNNSYTHIYAINSYIEGINKSHSIINKESKISEALVLRSMYFQALTQLFGDIPYVDTTDYKLNTKIKKTNYKDMLSLIEKDLLLAYDHLSYNNRHPENIYINKAVAELLLAKNYLLKKDYEKAEFYSRNLIHNTNYKLENDLNIVFKKNAKSTIWQLINSNPTAATSEARTFTIFTNTASYKLSDQLINSFTIDDKRKENWIATYVQNGNKFSYKYKNRLTNPDEYSVLFRIEEVYFILIESLIYQEKNDEAISYLDLIKIRAGIQKIPQRIYSKEEIINIYLEESKKEFFLEHGRRFFDLKRNNRLSLIENTKKNWTEKNRLFPYPEKEILINPSLNPQNDY